MNWSDVLNKDDEKANVTPSSFVENGKEVEATSSIIVDDEAPTIEIVQEGVGDHGPQPNQDQESNSLKPNMTGFLASHEKYKEFREFINHLLSTFMDDDTREIFMSEKALQVHPRLLHQKGFPKVESHPLGLNDKFEVAEGPFAIIRRAFTHAYVSDLNMESLETLGDGVLNEAVVMIIVGNWPNLLLQPSQVANMKKYHTNNVNIANYAQKLGFVRWIVRHPNQGLDSKERADIFESFIGAIVLIGEFYIGSQMGLAYARLFLDKFFATETWYPENSEFYEVPETLYNDWTTSLPAGAAPKSNSKIRREDDGTWRYTRTISDSDKSKVKAITDKTGISAISFSAVARKKDEAEHSVMQKIAIELKLSRTDINIERDKKRASMPEISNVINEILKIGRQTNKNIYVAAAKKAGRRVFVFVKERAKAKIGGRELQYERFVVNGEGETEVEALKDALGKMRRGQLYKTVAGFEYEIWNPDESDTPSIEPIQQFRPNPTHEVYVKKHNSEPRTNDNRPPRTDNGKGKGSTPVSLPKGPTWLPK